MFRNWLTSWKKVLAPSTTNRRRVPARPRRGHLEVEALEDRLVLSTLRTITYNQLTAFSDNGLYYDQVTSRICANGNKAVFSTSDGVSIKVYTINTDGTTGPTLVDPDAGTNNVDISADGSVVLETVYTSAYESDLRV